MDLHRRIPGSPAPRAEALLGLPGVLRPAQADETAVDTGAAAAGSRVRWRHWWRRVRPKARGSRSRSPACWRRSPRLHRASRGDLLQQAGERDREPRAFGLTRRHQCLQRTREARRRRACIAQPSGAAVPSRGCTPGRPSSASARGCRAAGHAPVQVHRQRQYLLQRCRIGGQTRLALTLYAKLKVAFAALQRLAGGLAQREHRRFPTGRQAQPQIKAATVDAARSQAQARPAALPSARANPVIEARAPCGACSNSGRGGETLRGWQQVSPRTRGRGFASRSPPSAGRLEPDTLSVGSHRLRLWWVFGGKATGRTAHRCWVRPEAAPAPRRARRSRRPPTGPRPPPLRRQSFHRVPAAPPLPGCARR